MRALKTFTNIGLKWFNSNQAKTDTPYSTIWQNCLLTDWCSSSCHLLQPCYIVSTYWYILAVLFVSDQNRCPWKSGTTFFLKMHTILASVAFQKPPWTSWKVNLSTGTQWMCVCLAKISFRTIWPTSSIATWPCGQMTSE